MKYLFKNWDRIQTQIQKANPLILLLDYDGTLTPIAAQPELAHCSPKVKGMLKNCEIFQKFILLLLVADPSKI